jgi:transmembrane sensor
MSQERFDYLLLRFKDNELTDEEREVFYDLVISGRYNSSLDDDVYQVLMSYAVHKDWTSDRERRLLDQLHTTLGFAGPVIRNVSGQLGLETKGTSIEDRRLRIRRRWTMAAAAVFVFLAAGAGFFVLRNKGHYPARLAATQKDIGPAGDKATLTLANGSIVVLDTVHDGQVAKQGGAVITRQNGQVIYHTDAEGSGDALRPDDSSKEEKYNTMTTPRGGRFKVVLPDGSTVLLNAASSLRYPTSFTGNQRVVELTGEAYFDIARNAAKPFLVKTNALTIKVLGTSFDVMVYPDEPVARTTLVNGSVQVSTGSESKVLSPGQQALVGGNMTGLVVRDADVDKETAWISGFFQFNHTDIQTIMREVSRWYDISVRYETPLDETGTYSGIISRNLHLSDLIAFLENNGIHHFRIEGRTLIVLP